MADIDGARNAALFVKILSSRQSGFAQFTDYGF